jgi:hypothetical protein
LNCLKQIDKKKFLLNLLKVSNLSKLSSEILKISLFARGLHKKPHTLPPLEATEATGSVPAVQRRND